MNERQNMIGITLLRSTVKAVDEAAVKRAADFAFAGAPEEPKIAPVKGSTAFGVLLGPLRLAVVSGNTPYFKDVGSAANRVPDVAGRIAVQKHIAWLSFQLIGTASQKEETVLGLLGQLAAEFCDENVLGLLRLPRGPLIGYDFSFIPLLRNRKATEIFVQGRPDRTVSAPTNSAALLEATSEARRRWPEFVKAFETRAAGEGFGVKIKFALDGLVEHMWLDVTAIEGGRIFGRLANQPKFLRSMKMGDPHTTSIEQIEDWIYMTGANQFGGFQAKSLSSRFHNSAAKASDPIYIELSHSKLRLLHPTLYGEKSGDLKIPWMTKTLSAEDAKTLLGEHLRLGDSRAALVMQTNPLLVAAYTDEQDAVLILKFPEFLVKIHDLKSGSRLLTTNTYGKGNRMAPDIEPGVANTGRYTNFYPVIADFLTDDVVRLEERKNAIAEKEWQRTETFARLILSRESFAVRDGRPLLSRRPGKV